MCPSKTEITRTYTSLPSSDEFRNTHVHAFRDFDRDAVEILNQIITRTACDIVVSSDWKTSAPLEYMQKFYQQQGVVKSPIAYTTWLSGYQTYHEQRASEISLWIEQNPEIKQWAAVDDLYMGTWLSNFVWAKKVHLGIKDVDVQLQLHTYLE